MSEGEGTGKDWKRKGTKNNERESGKSSTSERKLRDWKKKSCVGKGNVKGKEME